MPLFREENADAGLSGRIGPHRQPYPLGHEP